MGFFDRLFGSKSIFEGDRNPNMVCEMTLCGKEYILSEFDINFATNDRTREYFEAYIVFSDPINSQTESWITRGSSKETGVVKFYRNDDSIAEGSLFEIKFIDASCVHYRTSINGGDNQPVKMITITISHLYIGGEEIRLRG